jgi:hypothetical protein
VKLDEYEEMARGVELGGRQRETTRGEQREDAGKIEGKGTVSEIC